MSISRVSGADGYRYLMSSVVAADGDRTAANPLTRYYTETGTPPGRWIGAGLAGLDAGRGQPTGSPVTEEQLFRLLGMACDPVSGEPLGRAPAAAFPRLAERIRSRLLELPEGLRGPARESAVARILEEEQGRSAAGAGRAVAGFDLTFSVPKSVSALWAVADSGLRTQILRAHHAAIADALVFAEEEIFASRRGANGVAQVGVRGIVGAAFDHWDTRTNDPHLHTHVVVANRVQTFADDAWRTLDSRALFRATVALSELHQGLLMDRLSTSIGVRWEPRARAHSPVPRYAVAGVPESLCAEFSTRGAAIEQRKDRLVEAYRDAHGREPGAALVLKLRQQATLTDRPAKQVHSLAELTERWRERARPIVGADGGAWVRCAAVSGTRRRGRPAELDMRRTAEVVLLEVQAKRATFTRWNVYAEACRQLQAVRFRTAAERLQVTARLTEEALSRAVALTPPELASSPPAFRRRDGSTVFRRPAEAPYTTEVILQAEARLLSAGRDVTGPVAEPVATSVTVMGHARTLGSEQAAAVAQIATSGRVLDVLVGAAGTGKTAALAALVVDWQTAYGANSVIGLAPSATAAEVLAEHIGIATENTAKWLVEADRESQRLARIDRLRANGANGELPALIAEADRWRVHVNQLVIIDEASLAGTLTLDRIVTRARTIGAKVLLVGDWAQMSAVEAGGAFSMVVRDRESVPELTHVRRFAHHWERRATTRLRAGDPAVIEQYALQGRLAAGEHDQVLEAAHAAWWRDHQAGRKTLLIAADRDTVTELNARARAELVAAGAVPADGVSLADGTTAGLSDWIVTRRNDRTLPTSRGWVKNGDRWTVEGVGADGSLLVRRLGGRCAVALPPEYVAAHVALGYALTAHRAQGVTVDTAHVVVTGPTLARETLYVAMTRGRHGNHAYVATDYQRDPDSQHGPGERQTAREVLTAILTNAGADSSAHEMLRATQEAASSWRQLLAEYDTLAAVADKPYWLALLDAALPPGQADAIADSPAFGALATALRRADALGADVTKLLRHAVSLRELDSAADVAAVLHERVETVIATCDLAPKPDRLIGGLHPVARHVTDPEMRRALAERADVLAHRADAIAADALISRADWVRRLGAPPRHAAGRVAYLRCLRTVAAYRDRWGVTGPDPLGPAAGAVSVRSADRMLAQRAALCARRLMSGDDGLTGLEQTPRVPERSL